VRSDPAGPGWTPTITTPDAANYVTPRGTVVPNSPGLNLLLPFSTPTGNYSATLTVTLLSK
jgi:hypothetical protein